MQQATQPQLSPNRQGLYQPQADPTLQDKARTPFPQPQHEPLCSKESLARELDKDNTVTHHIPRLRAVVESQAFKNVLVDEMDMMLSRAATLIQANWRGYQLRQKLISQMMAAKAIQEAWRRFNIRRLLRSGKSVEKKVCMDEGDIPYHPPQQVRFQHPGESKSPLAQPIMVSKETQFPSSDSLATCTHRLALQTQSMPQPGRQAPCPIGGANVAFLPHQTVAIRLPCPVSLDAKCRPCLLTRTIRNACHGHVEGDTVKTKQVTARANKSGAPGPPPPGRYAQAVHGSLRTQTQAHVETEVFKALPQTGPAPMTAKTLPQTYPGATMTKTPPQPCVMPMGMIAKTPPQMYPAARMTKTPTQTCPATAVTKTPLQACLAAIMNKTPPQPCLAPMVTTTKSPPQMSLVGPVAKASPQTPQPATVTKTPFQSCLGAMMNKSPPQPCPAAPVSSVPNQIRATTSITNTSPQTRPAAMMAKISPQICLLASMIKPSTQTRPVAPSTKTPPQTCPVPTMAKAPTQMRPAAPTAKVPLQMCTAAATAKTLSQTVTGSSVTKTSPQTRLAAMVNKTPAQFRSVAAIIRTLCLPPPTDGNLKSSPPVAVVAGIPSTSSRTYLNGSKAKAVGNAKQTAGMVKISSHSYLAEGKVKYLPPPQLGAGTPKAPARPPLEAEKSRAFSQKQVKMETTSNTSVAVEIHRASPWAKVAEDRNKSSLRTHLRTDVVKVQSQVYVPVETAVILPQAQRAACPAKAPDPCLAKALTQERLATCSTTTSSQGQLLAELTTAEAQSHLGTCLSKTLSQAHLSAKVTKTPSFAHLGTCLTKTESQAHLVTGATKVRSQACLPTGLTKVRSQAQLVTGTVKCLCATHQPAELSGKTQSQPLLAGFKASSQPCQHVGAFGSLPQAKPEARLTQPQTHSNAQGRATQGLCQGASEIQSILVPLLASARHPTCNVESWGDSGATRAQPSTAGPVTACQEELAGSQLASLCAELAAELGSQEDLRALLAKALSQGQVRAALNQALTKKVLGATLAKALPQGMLGMALMKVLSWGELGIALSRTLTPTELRAELTKAKQGKLADVLSKALTEEEWAALSQGLCQGELGAVLSQSLSQAALRTGVVLPKATSKTAGSRMTVMPAPVEVGNPSSAWGPTLGPERPQPSKVRVPKDGAWGSFFTGRPAGFLEMGDGAMLGGSPCSSVVSLGVPLTSRVITTVHQYPLIAALDPTLSWEMGLSRGSSSNLLYLNPEVSEENVCLPPGASELASDLNPVENDTGPNLPKPSDLQPPPSLWQPLIANGVGPSTNQPSVAGGTAPGSHRPHVSRVAPRPWAASREGRAAQGTPYCTVGGGRASHSHQCVAAYGGSICWCQPSRASKVPPSVCRLSATKFPRQSPAVREETRQKTQSPNHKQASMDPRERINKVTSGPQRAASVNKAALTQPQTPKACDITLGLLPKHRWALKTQVNPSVFQASPGSRIARTPPSTAHHWQKKNQTQGTISSAHRPREQVTGHILKEPSLPQGPNNDLFGSLSQASTDCGPNVSNSQSSLTSGSSLSLSTMSVASLTAVNLVKASEPWEASLDGNTPIAALPSGEAVGRPWGPRDGEETRKGSWQRSPPNLCRPPSAGSEQMPVLHHSSVSGHVALSVHWGSDDEDERGMSSDQSAMDPKESLSQESHRTGLTRSVSLGNVVPTTYQQPSAPSRLTSSLSQPSVAGEMAPKPQQPFIVQKVTESSMASKVSPSPTEPSMASKVTPSLAQPSVTSVVAPSLTQLPVTGGVAPSLAWPSMTIPVAPSLAWPSVTGGVASNLMQASVTGRVAPSLTQLPVTGGVAPSLAQPYMTDGVALSLAQAPVASRGPLCLFQPPVMSGTSYAVGQSSWAPKVGSNLPLSRVNAVAPSLHHPPFVTEVPPSTSYPSGTSSMGQGLSQSSVTPGVDPCQDLVMVSGVASNPQAPEFSEVPLEFHQPLSVSGRHPHMTEHSAIDFSAPNLCQVPVASGDGSGLAQGTTISPGAPFRGMATSMSPGAMAAGMFPNMSWGTPAAGMFLSVSLGHMSPGMAGSECQRSVATGVGPNQFQVASGMTVEGAPLIHEQGPEVGPGLSQTSVPNRLGTNHQHPPVSTVVAAGYQQANPFHQEPVMGTASGLVPGAVARSVGPSLPPGSVIRDVGQSLPPGPVIGDVPPHLPPGYMVSGVAQTLPPGSVICGMGQGLPPDPMASAVAQNFPLGSVAGGMARTLPPGSVAPSLIATPGAGGEMQKLPVRPSVSFTAPSLVPGSLVSGVALSVSPESVTSGVAPAPMAGGLTQGLVLGSRAGTAGLPSTVGNMAQSLPQGSLLIGITPRPYHGSLAGEGPAAPSQVSHAPGLAQLHPQAVEASGTTRRMLHMPTVLQRASELNQALGVMPFETTDDQVMMKPGNWEKALSQVSVSSGESIVLEATPWMSHSLLSNDINHSLEFLPNCQRLLLEEVVPSKTKSLTSGVAPVPPQSLNMAKHLMAGGIAPTLQQRPVTTWGAPGSHSVTASRVPSVHLESVKATGALLAHQQATMAHVPQSPSVALIGPQSHAHQTGAFTLVSGSPRLAHDSTVASIWPPGSIAGMGTPSTSQRSGAASVASHVPLYPPLVSGVAPGGFQMDTVPSTHQKPVSGDLAQTNHKFLGSKKSYRSVHGNLVSEMLDDSVARIVSFHDVREHAHRSSQESPECFTGVPPAIAPITHTEATHNMAIPRLHPGFQKVFLGYESSPDGSQKPLFTQESMQGPQDFRSAVAPEDSHRASLTPTVLQGPVDAGIAGGQAWNSAVPSVAVRPMNSAVARGGPWEPPRAPVPRDTVGREAAVDLRRSGELVASIQVVEKMIIRAVVTIQAGTRGYLVRRTIKVWHQWAVIIQAAWRGYCVRRDLSRLCRAATVIQALWRGFCTRRAQTQPALLPATQAGLGGRTKSISDHRCFQSCQPHVCTLCRSLSPRVGSPPSVVMLVGSSPRTCHMCGHTLPTRVVHGTGRGSQAGVPWGCVTQTTAQSPQQSRQQNKAATTIQSAWRGFTAPPQQSRQQNKAATTIQSAWRGFTARRQLRQQQGAAKMLQATWRGHHTRATLTTDALLGPAAWDSMQHMQWPGV